MRHEVVERSVPHPPEAVFDWFTSPELLTRWWPDEAEVDLEEGGDYRLHWSGPDVTLRGTYRVVDRPSRLGFTWSWDQDDLPPRAVDIELRSEDCGTAVRIRHEAGSDDEAGDY